LKIGRPPCRARVIVMNGLAATLAPPSSRRLLRGVIFLLCCVLSVSLLGAVHTRTRDADRAADETVSAQESEVALAAYQEAPARRRLLPEPATPRTAGTGELLQELKNEQPIADLASAAASFKSTVEKLVTPAAPSGRVIWMEVTAYCPCKKCCGPRAQGITASGRPVSHNGGRFVAADTKVLAFNTRLVIPGYADGATVPVIDRGGAIKGRKLDVYFPTHEQAKHWGRRWVPVTVVE
jgi:3D (Asp-Asp-Asp) domain-containing protein